MKKRKWFTDNSVQKVHDAGERNIWISLIFKHEFTEFIDY